MKTQLLFVTMILTSSTFCFAENQKITVDGYNVTESIKNIVAPKTEKIDDGGYTISMTPDNDRTLNARIVQGQSIANLLTGQNNCSMNSISMFEEPLFEVLTRDRASVDMELRSIDISVVIQIYNRIATNCSRSKSLTSASTILKNLSNKIAILSAMEGLKKNFGKKERAKLDNQLLEEMGNEIGNSLEKDEKDRLINFVRLFDINYISKTAVYKIEQKLKSTLL
jgi:hypothetical protein